MTFKRALLALSGIALPLMGGLAAQTAVQIIDTLMLGRYSVEALAGAVVATSVLFVFITVGSGLATAVLTICSGQADAQNPKPLAAGIWLSITFSALSVIALLWSEPLLLALGQEPAIAVSATEYLWIAGVSLFPALLTATLRGYATARERTQVILWVSLAALPLNALFNWMFIFGNFGAPEMGIQGAALATLLAHTISFLATAAYVRSLAKMPLGAFLQIDRSAMAQVLRIGTPIGVTGLAELGMFTAITLMIGTLGALPVAAHGVVVQITSAAFIIHLALSQAATVRVARGHSAADQAETRVAAKAAAALSAVMVALTTCLFVFTPETLVRFFVSSDDPAFQAILTMASAILIIAAVSQLADAMQIVAMGALRGLQETAVPMWIAAGWYWAVALPLGYVLGLSLGWGAVGVWSGVTVGLLGAAGTLWWRFFVRVTSV